MLQSQYRGPWLFVGDFNAVLGAHEKRGKRLPPKLSCKDFLLWTNANHLLYLNTIGVHFTWANGRAGNEFVTLQLDHSICNQAWQSGSPSLADCARVVKEVWAKPVHGSLMLCLQAKLKRLKAALKEWNLAVFGNVDHNVNSAIEVNRVQVLIDENGVTDELQKREFEAQLLLSKVLMEQDNFWREKARVNNFSFGDCNTAYFHRLAKIRTASKPIAFLQHDYGIITMEDELESHIVNYFKTIFCETNNCIANSMVQDCIPSLVSPEDNVSLTTLPSELDIKTAVFDMNGDGALKIITKILAGRLSLIATKIISPQRGFIPERHISDCVIITSEAINVLSKKSYAGNIALKIDIRKAFDTLDWNFLLSVLKHFGFCATFCAWIEEILLSARLSVLVNGKLAGFFNCTRGVRQGDPLSPLLFCIAEEVLSRSISNALLNGELSLMTLCRNTPIPFHVLYADDIMVFCKGSKKNIRCLMRIFHAYGQISGQVINTQKSKFYSGAISNSRLLMLTNLLGFCVGSIPFNYLGCPIFVGNPKVIHFKACLMEGCAAVNYGESPIDRWIRNFIWSGDINTKKVCTVAWSKVCRPFAEGGLNIRSLRRINDSLMLHLCWKFLSCNDQWAVMCRARFLKWGQPLNTFLKSSVWHGIKRHVTSVKNNSRGLIGTGNDIAFWLDTWLHTPWAELFHFPPSSYYLFNAKASSFIENGTWNIPESIMQQDASIRALIDQVILPRRELEDRLVWCPSEDGSLSAKQAYDFLYAAQQPEEWTDWVWHMFVPPSTSFIAWRCFQNKMPTDENLMKQGCIVVSACDLCLTHFESTSHLFLSCTFATRLWSWLGSLLRTVFNATSFFTIFESFEPTWSASLTKIATAAVLHVLH
ncbi:ribonuclease H [Trifolium pratense]|uniref:Ribonuclease H n=1 Tax=Trifolium pratense TaxID=57577 RepID=A0A2K3NKV3_TRIPR|nr:ribonuclease H [Trifolium pratense]